MRATVRATACDAAHKKPLDRRGLPARDPLAQPNPASTLGAVKYSCNSCGKRYSIPQERVTAAGPEGLRIRCSRCRAIMAIADGDGEATGDWSRDEVTEPQRLRSKPTVLSPEAVHMVTDDLLPDAPGPEPAARSESGVYRPLPGVEREVTGMHLIAADDAEQREWYAAFGGRARGPFSREEMKLLARKGRIAGSTLVWKPGFGAWHRVQEHNHSGEHDLLWLRSLLETRRRRERKGALSAEAAAGITRMRMRKGEFLEPRKTPPPIPGDAVEAQPEHRPPVLFVGKRMPSYAADRLFGETQLGGLKVREETLVRERRRYRRRMFFAGALIATLGVVAVGYTLPALGVDTLSPVFRLVASLLSG